MQVSLAQIPWCHHISLLTKIKDVEERVFYLTETANNGWSRDTMLLQIKGDLYNRQGQAITNFKETLPLPQSNLAQQTMKDPYLFDFLNITDGVKERDIEKQLVDNVSKFLLELGKGFAFIAKQYHLEVAEQDYYLDLLFYHVKLKCYVVIELKNTKFIPEYAGKLNFYLSAVDDALKRDSDYPSIGILLCRDKNNLEVEFALRGMSQPMGVSEFNLTEVVPESLRSSLPTIEELEREL
ncbi:PDDEXK nuclease domain-containing protein [Flavivirga jejuensis]|uniref:PDDEXK nuclease domain-containing protein n=3 Tax=Flavivirga jejuensis TaxID=870487 RepID=A0ABT8WV74_9FLAO|nr:PDDEXK nuclease domain-containing protein [Flavivirga jejuensis]MDO5977090.1 PDDEXK nuclease domain-containing protein [Flavivirga jejuensis]